MTLTSVQNRHPQERLARNMAHGARQPSESRMASDLSRSGSPAFGCPPVFFPVAARRCGPCLHGGVPALFNPHIAIRFGFMQLAPFTFP